MKKNKILLSLLALIPLLINCQKQETSLESFPPGEVELLDSPFLQAEQTDMNYILELDVDRLLAPYLREAGLTPKAESYGNWENTGLDGHIGGHYLTALSLMYASTGDVRMKERMDYMISELKKCQDSFGDGYLAGIPGGHDMWKEIARGEIDAGSFSLNKKWVPLYNIHKIYAGLRDAYLYGGSEVAKDMLIKLSDWAIQLVSKLSNDQIQDMLRSEHGGLNEVFADVAEITGDSKYLHLARQFSDLSILNPLLNHEDKLTGLHANTQIPKVIGYKRIADIENNKVWSDAAKFFWEDVVTKRSVCIGGNSVREHFHPVDDYSSMLNSEQGPETCNTYNMLKLTKMLFLSDPQGKYMDYYERALYNHILSTQNPDKGGFVYFTPMRPGHYRVYSQPQTSFWCCVGSGLENHAKYGEMIYAHQGNDLFVNLFIPSKLTWKEKNVEIIQKSAFPESDIVSLTINPQAKAYFTLKLRYPQWVNKGELKLELNGESFDYVVEDNGYVSLHRKWTKGDELKIILPMHIDMEQIPDHEHFFSFKYGPVVLAAKTDTTHMDGMFADDSRGGHIAAGPKVPLQDMPIIVSQPDELLSKIKMEEGKALRFTIDSLYSDKYQNLELMPFYDLHESRYIVYWQSETKEGVEDIQHKLAEEEKAKQELDAQTLDLVYPGEQQPESDHFIKSENSNMGVFNGKHWRDATGWFSYDLRDSEKKAKKLRVMYCGYNGGRTFSIFINDKKLKDVVLENNDNVFYTIDYNLPEEIVKTSNGKLVVKFIAAEGSIAGGVFEVRLMK